MSNIDQVEVNGTTYDIDGGHTYDIEATTNKDEVNLTEDGTTKTTLPLPSTFVGIRTAWDNLSAQDKAKYLLVHLTDDASHMPYFEYSTTEKVVGKWTTGKPLYQKTIIDTMPKVTSNGTYATKYVAHNVANVEVAFITNAFLVDSSTYSRTLMYLLNSGVQTKASVNATYVQLTSGIVDHSESDVYVTIQYTKTTD